MQNNRQNFIFLLKTCKKKEKKEGKHLKYKLLDKIFKIFLPFLLAVQFLRWEKVTFPIIFSMVLIGNLSPNSPAADWELK